MSPESVLLSGAPAAPGAPQPARSAPVPASRPGAGSAAGTGSDQPQAVPSPAPARSATAHSPGRKDSGERNHAAGHKSDTKHKHAASGTVRAKGYSTQPATRPARPDGSFSKALAQSLAMPGHGGASPSGTVRDHAAPAGKHAAHASAKENKSDPVARALALVSQAPPTASPAGTTGAGHGKGQGTMVTASLLEKPKGDGHGAKGLLAHAAAQDLKALGSADTSAAATPATAPVNAAAALTGAQASAATGAAAAPAHTVANPTAALSAPVGTTAWTDELGTHLTWMTHQGIGSVSLQLSPKHLGPLQVSISVHHGQASVWFGAAHAETRQALEQAMPQLRQMFSGQGLTLTDSGVSRESPRDQAPRKGSVGQIGAVAEEPGAGASGSVAARLGLVDAYA